MVIASLSEALQLVLRYPVLWIAGLVTGLIAAGELVIESFFGTFFAGKILFLLFFVILFFTTGLIGSIHRNDFTAATLVREGAARYFRVLIPTLIVMFSIALVVIIIAVTAAVAGFASNISLIATIAILVTIPVILVTFFYDTAAVFEDKKAFESIRRSIELVSSSGARMAGFFLTAIAIFLAILFAAMVAWTGILYDRVLPLTSMNTTEIAVMTPDTFVSLLGTDGIWITAIIYFIGITLEVTILAVYKACFFRRLTSTASPIQQMTGEFDDKGRWYKY